MGQRIGGVIFQHGADPLKDDRAGIVTLIDEMNRASAELATLVDYRLMHPPAEHSLAAEIRQQGRMNVHHSPMKCRRYLKKRKPTGQADQVNFCIRADIENQPTKVLNIGVFLAIDDMAFQSCSPGPIDASDAGREATTTAILAFSDPSPMRSIRFCSVVPDPLISTAS